MTCTWPPFFWLNKSPADLEALAQGGGREVMQQEVAVQRVNHGVAREYAVEGGPQQHLRQSERLLVSNSDVLPL